jgi:ADP-heptose:LPS heptosyltransferase
VDKIHSEYNAVIIQFGTSIRDGLSGYDKLTGVQPVTNRRKGEEVVALIAICDLIIAIDSGPVHLAGAVGTPVIGLFGPLDPLTILPPESPALGLFSDVPCLFCFNRTPVINWLTGCPNDIACMKNLGCHTVFEAVKTRLPHRSKCHKDNQAQIESQSPDDVATALRQ